MKKDKWQIIGGACCSVIVLVSIMVYLILGVTDGIWHPGWLIPVCAALFCGVIGSVTSAISKLIVDKEDEKEQK